MFEPTFFAESMPAATPAAAPRPAAAVPQAAAPGPTAEPVPFPPLFGPFVPRQTIIPPFRPVVGLTPQEAWIGGLTMGAIVPALTGHLLTLFNVAGAGQVAGQLRAVSFLSGLGMPPAFLFTPQPPPVSLGTIPYPTTGTLQPPGLLYRMLLPTAVAFTNLVYGPPPNLVPPTPVMQPLPIPTIGPIQPQF